MNIIVIGAGAAGLMAAKKLSEAGVSVIILEARNRIGGRIYTITDDNSLTTIEGGAEFIHGNLDVTLELLKEAGIEKQEVKGEFIHVINGNWTQENNFFKNAELVINRLKSLKEDISIAAFLQRFFAEEKYLVLRKSLISYAEGYYSGEIEKMSSKAFLAEWLSEDEQQYRPTGGYGGMLDYLTESCRKAGTQIHLSAVAKEIKWHKGYAEVIDDNDNIFTASKVIVTVPLGVWLAEKSAKGSLQYLPELPAKALAAKQMGFGSVIKILLEFKDMFWEDEAVKNKIKTNTANIHMALSDAEIPTWWTQFPKRIPLLTGWLSGPKAELIKNEKEEDILLKALNSLSLIFKIEINILTEKLKWWKVFNWTKDEFTLGSYSYSTLHTTKAREILAEPVENTLFFAGEALYKGPETGTVEAALTSGLKTASEILLAIKFENK